MLTRLAPLWTLLCLAPALGQETVTLRWQFPEGEAVAYRFDQERALEIRRPNLEPAKQRRSRKTEFTLTGRPSGAPHGLELEVQLVRLRERVVRGKEDRQLDSGTLDTPGNWDQARQLLRPIRVRHTERGGPFELQRWGEQELAELPAAERAQWESVLGDGIVRTLAFSLLGSFPERPVRVGGQWEAETVLELPGQAPVTMKLTNTLESFRGSGEDLVAVIRQQGEAGGRLMELGVEAWQQEGVILFDVLRGQIRSTEFATRLISNQDEELVQVDTAHRLVRVEPVVESGDGDGDGDTDGDPDGDGDESGDGDGD